MIRPEDELPRPAQGEGFGDAVTYAFGDRERAVYATVRLGLVPGAPPRASSITLMFHGTQVASVASSGAVELDRADWADVTAGDVTARIVEPLRRWAVSYDGDEGGFEVTFEALGAPAEIDPELGRTVASLNGYEQLCRVEGTAWVGDERWPIRCLGQRGHQWGAPDWRKLELSRTLGVWLDDGRGIALSAVRPRGHDGHEDELVSAFLLEREPTPIDDPRLSTTLGDGGRQLRAGLELWVDDDGPPLHAAGEAICGTTFDLGELRLDCSFFAWRMGGRTGVGRYDLLRRA